MADRYVCILQLEADPKETVNRMTDAATRSTEFQTTELNKTKSVEFYTKKNDFNSCSIRIRKNQYWQHTLICEFSTKNWWWSECVY